MQFVQDQFKNHLLWKTLMMRFAALALVLGCMVGCNEAKVDAKAAADKTAAAVKDGADKTAGAVKDGAAKVEEVVKP